MTTKLQNGGAAGGNLQALHNGFTPCQFHEIVLRFFRLTPARRRGKLRGKFGGAFGAHCASVSGQG